MKGRDKIQQFLRNTVNKFGAKLLAFVAISCIIFALTFPLSHRLIAKNGLVDMMEEVLEKGTGTFDSLDNFSAPVPFKKELIPSQAEATHAPFSTSSGAELLRTRDILPSYQATPSAGNKASENGLETRTVPLLVTTQDGRYPVNGMDVYLYRYSETGDLIMFDGQTGSDGRIVFDNVLAGKKYEIIGGFPPGSGYRNMTALTVDVPPVSQHPETLFFHYTVALEPFEIVINNVDENDQPIIGSSFSLKKGQQTIGTAESLDTGTATFSNIPTAGVYRLKQDNVPDSYQSLASEIKLLVCQNESGMPVQAFVNDVPYTEGLQWRLVNNRYQLSIKVRNSPKGTVNPRNASLRIRKVLAAGGQEIINTGEIIDSVENQEGLDDVWFAVICLWDKHLSEKEYAALADYQAAYRFYEENLDNAQVIKTTTINGIKGLIELEDLPANIDDYGDSRYLILELNDEDHPLPEELVATSEPLIVNLPTLSEDRKSYNFQVKLYPKNEKVSANVEIFKSDDQHKGLAGASFNLYKKIDETYILDENSPYISNTNGKIFINELGAGRYYLQEIISPAGYQLDETEHHFEIDRSYHKETIPIQIINYLAIEPPTKIVEKPTYDFGETIRWEMVQKLPVSMEGISKLEFHDELDPRLNFVPDSIEVTGLEKKDFSTTIAISDGVTTIVVKVKQSGIDKLKGQQQVLVKIQTTFNTKNSEAIENTVRVETNISNKTSQPAQVVTGKKIFKKINETSQPLQGAVFVVRKEVDEQLLYMKRTVAGTNWLVDIEQATRITSEADGIFAVEGLAYGAYELIETKVPTTDAGQYGLKSDPVPFVIDAESHQGEPLEIRNYLVPVLPITGGIGIAVILISGLFLMGIALRYYLKKTDA